MIKDLLNFGPQGSPYTTKPPFSFTYGGKSSAELLNIREQKHLVRKLDDRRTEHTLTYTTDPKSDLVIRCIVIEYHDFPTVEWTLYFKNMDVSSLEEMTGSELMEKGLVVSIPNQPGAVIITYEKVK